MQQHIFNEEVDRWIKDINNRLNLVEISNKQLDTIASNQECDIGTIHMLIARVEELNEEVRHIRKLQAIMVDLTRYTLRNSKILSPKDIENKQQMEE